MLKGERLSFRYKSTQPWILHQVSLEISPGEIVGLLGASGFGKTTLGKLLAGYLTPNTGKVTLDNRPLPQRGYCPVQLIFQHPELTMNPRWRIGKILTEGQPADLELLQQLGIHQNWLSRYPHELSGGELQRIAVARSLTTATRYLIADEMTAMLDANTQALIWQAVLEHTARHQLGVLVISHDLPLIERICDRAIDLSKLCSASYLVK